MTHHRNTIHRRTGAIAIILALTAALALALVLTMPAWAQTEEPWRAAVTGVTLSPGDQAGELVIAWDAHPEGAEDYRVRWAPDGEAFKKFDDPDGNAYPATNSHTVTGLVPGATYKVQVRARYDDNARRSAWSDVVTGQSAPEPPPEPVTGLTAGPGTSAGSLSVTWDAHPDGAASYQVAWTPEGEDFKAEDDADWNAAVTTNSHTVNGLNADAAYKVRVKAKFQDDVESEWSGAATGQSAPEPTPDPVTGLTAGPGDNAGELNIAWDAHPDGATSYHVAWTPDGEDFKAEDDADWNAAVTTNTYTAADLEANAAHKVRVKALFDDDQESDWSEAVTGQSAHERANAISLGDISDDEPTNIAATVDDDNPIGYFRFSLSERREVRLRIRSLEFNADLYVEDKEATVLASSENTGTDKEVLNITLDATAADEFYYVRVEAKENGRNDYTFRYLTAEPSQAAIPPVPPPQIVAPTPEPPLQFLHSHQTLPWTGHTVNDIQSAQTGEITSANDVDWYKLDGLTARHVYQIQYADPPAGRNRVEKPKITVYGSDGEPVVQNGYEVSSQRHTYKHFSGAVFQNDPPEICFYPDTNGTYHLGVSSTIGDTGSFIIRWRNQGGDSIGDRDSGDCYNTTNGGGQQGDTNCRITPDSPSVEGTKASSGDDRDNYNFYVRPGANYLVCAEHDDDTKWIEVASPYAGAFERVRKTGEPACAVYDGRHWAGPKNVTIFAQNGDYEVHYEEYPKQTISEESSRDLPAGSNTYGHIIVDGEGTTGDISSASDQDWFKVLLEAGTTYQIDVRGATTSDPGGTLTSLDMLLVDESDDAKKVDTGIAAKHRRLYYRPNHTDPLYLRVDNGSSSATGTYTATITTKIADLGETISEGSGDDLGITVAAMGAVQVGRQGATGSITPDTDLDRFRVILKGGESYRIDVKGSAAADPGGTLPDPAATLNDDQASTFEDSSAMVVTNGAVITTGGFYEIYDNDRGEGNNARIEVDVLETDLYHIDVFTDGEPGTYTLLVTRTSDEVQINKHIHGPNTAGRSISEPLEQDFPNSTSTKGYIEPDGKPVTGNIGTSSDRDLFKTHLIAGQSYQIDMKGAEPTDQGGSLEDPALGLAADSRTVLAISNDHVTQTFGDHVEEDSVADDDSGAGYNARMRFTVKETGTYHILALEAADARTGTYEITLKNVTPRGTPLQTISEFDGLDYPNKRHTKGYLQVDGDAATGLIKWVGDRDMYRIQVQKDQHYLLTVTGDTLDSPRVELRDEFENRIWNEHNTHEARQLNWSDPSTHWTDAQGDSDSSGLLLFRSRVNGKMFANVSGGSGTGTYSVKLEQTDSVSEPDGENFPFDATSQGYITANGDDVTGEREHGTDGDPYQIDLKAGRHYRIEMRGSESGDGTLEDPILRLGDDSLTRVTNTDTAVEQTNDAFSSTHIDNDSLAAGQKNARLDLTVHENGTYFVVATGSSTDTGTYQIVTTSWFTAQGSMATVSEGTVDLPINATTTGYVQVSGDPAYGEIESNADRDWFKVDLVAGQTYRVDLKGNEATDYGGTLPRPILSLSDPATNLITDTTDIVPIVGTHDPVSGFFDFNSGEGENSRLQFKVKTSGTYFLEAGESKSEQGTYTLTVVRTE